MFVEVDSFSSIAVYVKTSYLGQEHISIHSRNNKKTILKCFFYCSLYLQLYKVIEVLDNIYSEGAGACLLITPMP